MKKSNLTIGKIELPSNILQAPLAGYTDFVFRENCLKFGAGLCYTEMVSAKGLCYNSEKTKELLILSPLEKIKAVQIFGEDAEFMRRACESEHLAPFDIIDINMGCPVPKLFKNGEGCALMGDLHKAEKIISECVKSGKTVTVKTRTGINKDKINAVEFAKMCEGAGASAITVHGRTREEYYSGTPDYKTIAAVKNFVKIPVIANGGIFDKESCDKLYDETGADGVMIARGSIGRPWIFAEVLGEKPEIDLKKIIISHLTRLSEVYGDKQTASFRKFFPYYLKGLPLKESKIKLMKCSSVEEEIEIIENLPI